MLYEDNEGLVRLQVDDNGGDDVNFDNDNDAGDDDERNIHFLVFISS